MKRTLTLVVLLILAIATNAQAYVPFPASNALWTLRQGNGEAYPSYFCYGLKAGDTVLGAKTYHKLYKSADSVLADSEFYGGIREDGAKRVYYYRLSTATETMLYDFSLSAGDTVRVLTGGPVGIVNIIDSINIGGQYRKRINFRTTSGTAWTLGSWIEGIGNSALGGLLNSAMAQPTCDCAASLRCFRQNGAWVYHNTDDIADCFGPALGIKQPSVRASSILFPNPLAGVSRIRVTGNHSFKKLVVYNTNGACVLSYELADNQDIILDSAKLPAGVYYYRLSDDSGTAVTEKFVVQ